MLNEEQKIIKVVKKTLPSVVNITISKEVAEKTDQSLIPKYDGKKDNKPNKLTVGGGSGFIVSKDGMVLTNRHVVSEKDAEYKAITADGKKHQVKIIAKDPINDIAVLKINTEEKLPALPLGNSDKLELGQTVIAIGNALALFSNSVSKGIISGLSRLLTAGADDGGFQNLRGLIQTDAAINLGNSGGPLLNLNGEVIGINAVILHDAENISFAIPINNIKRDLDDIKKHGKIIQPFLGVRYAMIGPEIKKRSHLPINYGAWLISEHLPHDDAVTPGSPAQKAGLLENDIILEFNNKRVDFKNHLQDLIRNSEMGKSIPVKILRNGEQLILSVTLSEQTDI